MATTTATVTGLVCLELYKIVQDKKLEDFKNAFVNLALPLFAFSEPVGVKTTEVETKNGEWNWSIWDRIDVEGPNMTLNDFIKHIIYMSLLLYWFSLDHPYASWLCHYPFR